MLTRLTTASALVPRSLARGPAPVSQTQLWTIRNAASHVPSATSPITSTSQRGGIQQRCASSVAQTTASSLASSCTAASPFQETGKSNVPSSDKKKTLVLLGTGWGTTTILKNVDTLRYNVVVVSPRNYFLFTPLLPSCTVGTTESRSIMEPIRHIVGRRGKAMRFYEAECQDIDVAKKELKIEYNSNLVEGTDTNTTASIKYDYLVVGVGGTYNTFGTPGVEKYACFLKEMGDASKIRRRLKDTIEKASFDHISAEERSRLLNIVVVGGGPTGVEFAGELHDLISEDLSRWVPELSKQIKITLIEALPNVLPSFDKKLVTYTEAIFKKNGIGLRTSTKVNEVNEKTLVVSNADGTKSEIPYGTIVWAAGISARKFAHTLRSKVPDIQTSTRGLIIDDYLRVKGTKDIWALGDCTVSKNAPLAQVASQQGKWLSKMLNQIAKDEKSNSAVCDVFAQLDQKVKPFVYSSNGSLAYIGGEKAIAELPFFNKQITAGGPLASLFWKSYCLWELSSVRSSLSVATDWAKRALFGRTMSVD
ncbi:NADH:ubiquinone oxidoreductase [Coemansia sp. RSA 1813]|nr:NADH:ubiquinone oxidoreductase [Coemansia sp. RSA 1646]KAJ1773771.1 NADH:ubiquinone oxidoreductase [Coemansia sp. RSA 1843]KAJ2093734.1 NADH:ubiquinone oxidoreductase [Coemansia sp. RSA 986]KAJ2217945.1 NADH:ubiquinone oxidoreductase [Coemansia sp. RSA 487]KAJ2573212.1 NADH:ubiquinone oxidoreductase [Coemansia sp. RSA 1813]